jgi:hypothetical protein
MPSLRKDFHKLEQKQSEIMANAMEIAPNEGMPALPPLPPVAPVVHAPGEGVGQNWPLASAEIAVAWPQLHSPATHFWSNDEGMLDKSAE